MSEARRCQECQVEIMAITAKANQGYCRKCRGGLGRNDDDGIDVWELREQVSLVISCLFGAWLGWKLLSHFHWILGLVGIPLGLVVTIVVLLIVDLIILFTCGIPMLGGVWLLILLWEGLQKKFRRPNPQEQRKE